MKLAVGSHYDDVRSQIKDRFAEFNRKSSASKGRKYPADLRDLVRQGAKSGIKPKELERLSGMSSTAIKTALAAATTPVIPPVAPRRLQVVGEASDHEQGARPLVVRLPSGVTIELASEAALTTALLLTLARLEVNHAASR